jgi:hypothetical protein
LYPIKQLNRYLSVAARFFAVPLFFTVKLSLGILHDRIIDFSTYIIETSIFLGLEPQNALQAGARSE